MDLNIIKTVILVRNHTDQASIKNGLSMPGKHIDFFSDTVEKGT